jgi:predicted dehydrogenase
MADLRTRFGRRLRLAFIGGGPGSWIGRIHRSAAEMDGWWHVVGGVFSSDPSRSRSAGAAMGFDQARCYGTLAEMLAAERARADGVDAVAIMGPNDTHYPAAMAALDAGLDVIGEKPVSTTFAEACDLVARARARDRVFAIAHGYSAFPMTRHARDLVAQGLLGKIRLVQVEYMQNGMAARVEDDARTTKLQWVLDPSRSGMALVMSAIGCHAHHLACSVSGLAISRVMASVGALVPDREVADYASALLQFHGGARGTFTATQAAVAVENDIRLRVHGERGMLDWSLRVPSYMTLALKDEPVRTIGRGDSSLPAEIIALGRTPRGHPEGLREAFANLYVDVALARMSRALGDPLPPVRYPTIAEGAGTMAFIEACLASERSSTWADVASLPSA